MMLSLNWGINKQFTDNLYGHIPVVDLGCTVACAPYSSSCTYPHGNAESSTFMKEES